MGEKISLFRTANGNVGAISSYCPHLGADLSAGKIEGETIVCPFHGLRITCEGKIPALPNQAVKNWKTFENGGVIFIKQNNLKGADNIFLPKVKTEEWSKPIFFEFKIKSHPQEILENSVDILHFQRVHSYTSINLSHPFTANGAEFSIQYQLERRQGIFGWLDSNKLKLNIAIHAYGLGYSEVHIHIPKYNLLLKQIVLPTPIDADWICIRTATMVKRVKNIFLPALLENYWSNFLNRLAAKGFLQDFLPDINIWQNKIYIEHPNCFPSDKEIEKFRNWAKQFYLN